MQRSSWQNLALSLFAALSVAAIAVVPALAATSAKGSVHKTVKSHAAKACKKRVKASGSIRWSDWQFPSGLNPYQTSASVATENYDNLLEGLIFNTNNKGQLAPDMLTKLPSVKNGGIRNGGKTYILHLKPGIHWSNGKVITAQDIKFGWQIGMNKVSGPWCSGSCDVIRSITTQGKYTMVVQLKTVYAAMLSYGLSWPIVPRSYPGRWPAGNVSKATHVVFQDQSFNYTNKSFITNGAFQVTDFVRDNRIKYAPMKYYNTMTCGARLKSLTFAFYASKQAMIDAAAAQDTDSTTNYTLGDLKILNQFARQGKFTLHNDPGFLIEHLTFNVDPRYGGHANPLHSQKVRLALSLALDKLGLIRSALGLSLTQARAVEAWTPLINTPRLHQPFVNTHLTGQWDPIRHKYLANTGKGQALADAKTLLKQAGYPGGKFSLDAYTTQGNAIRQAQFAVITNNWKKVGVGFNAHYVPVDLFFSDWQTGSPLNKGTFQVAMFADVGYPDPDNFKYNVGSKYIDRKHSTHSTLYANFAGIQDKSIDQDFAQAAKSLNNGVRQSWYNKWQVTMNKQAYWLDLFYRGAISTDNGRIGNYTTNPSNAGEQWNTWEWYRTTHR